MFFKPDALFTKHYRDKIEKTSKRKLSSKVKDGVKSILFQAAQEQDRKELNFSSDDDNLEYVPKPLKASHRKVTTQVTYVPSSKSSPPTDSDSYLDGNCSDVIIEEGGLPQKTIGQKFIITLDGIERRNNNGEDVLVKKQNLPILFKNVR